MARSTAYPQSGQNAHEHRAWCRYRKTSDESTKTLGLMRTVRTQGVLLRLPRLACHRCLLPFAGGMHPVEHISRQTAERHLRAILCSGHADVVPAGWEADGWTTTTVPPGADSTESHLEQHFRKVFRDRVTALGATVRDIPGATGNTLRLSFPGGTRVWTLEPQVLMAGSRPDFVLRCNDHNVPPVAIFTDGR